MFKKLLLILCFGLTSAVFYGCTQPQKGGEEETVVEEGTVEEVVTPTETPAATPMQEPGESGTN